MRSFTFLLPTLFLLMGTTTKAETVTDDFTGYPPTSSGQTLGDNWYIFPGDDGNYGRFGSDYTYKNNTYDGPDYNYVTGYSSNYNKNVWLVLKKEVSGSVVFRSRMGRNSGTLFVTNNVTAVGDGTFTVDKAGALSYSISTTASSNEYDAGTMATYVAFCLTSDQMRLLDVTYTEFAQTDGPALAVSGDNEGVLDFGMVNPGDTRELTLSNPGTENISVDITTEGGFTASPTSATIEAGGTLALTIAAPDATATGKVTITPTTPTVEAVEIALSCTVKDPTKMYVDFADNALPEDWTEYTASESYAWTYADGYAQNTGGTYYEKYLMTPPMTFENDEAVMFDAEGNNAWAPEYGSNYEGSVTVKVSADGTTFTDLQTFAGLQYNTWQHCSVTVPAGTKYIRFYVDKYANIDNIYGGTRDATPRPKLEVEGIANGGSLSWGFADVPAGSTKTITLRNDGKADLDVTIAATDDYTVDPASATVEAEGGTVEVCIGTPAHDGNGVLTITPSEDSGLPPYSITLSSYYKEPKPEMSLDKTSVEFGKVNEVKSDTITVSNTGDGELLVTIENDNTTNFTVSETTLTVAPGEAETFTITYNFAEGTWGTFTANVKLTPNTDSAYDAKTITVSATSKDPDLWSEDFEEGTVPEFWANAGWSVLQPSAFIGGNGTYMASPAGNKSATLITPRLTASKDQELKFYVYAEDETYFVKAEYSDDDQATWNEIATYTTAGEQTFVAPADGKYYIRFTGFYTFIDNFEGFKLDLPEHILTITANNIPASSTSFPAMKEGVSFNAYVTLSESLGVDEEDVVAKLYMNGEVIGTSETVTVEANSTRQIDITCTPPAAAEDAEMYIEVTYAGGTLTSATEIRTVAAATRLDLNEDENIEIAAGDYDIITLTRSFEQGWNTFIAPFGLSTDTFGEGARFFSFAGFDETEKILSFSEERRNQLNPATPYIVYLPEAFSGIIEVKNVTIMSAYVGDDNLSSSWNGFCVRGTYAPVAAGEWLKTNETDDIYGVTSDGIIQKADQDGIKGFRAYLDLPAGTEIYTLRFGDIETALNDLKDSKAPKDLKDLKGLIFNLAGQTANRKSHGIFIVNGKKIAY